MKLSKYIQDLQKLLKEHGDLEIIYASDDEGNDHNKVSYTPSMVYYSHSDRCVISEDEMIEYELEDEYEKVICIN